MIQEFVNFNLQPYWKLFLEDKQYQVSFAGTEKFESSEQALQTARTLDRVAEVLDVVEEDVVKAPPSLLIQLVFNLTPLAI